MLNAIMDMKQHISQSRFHSKHQQHVHSAIDLYICATGAVRIAHKVCDECENGRLPFIHHAGFDEFLSITERLKMNSILSYLDGPLEDLLAEDMDGVLARIHQCAITYRLKIGRALCDVAPFGCLLESIQEHGHIFPVCT